MVQLRIQVRPDGTVQMRHDPGPGAARQRIPPFRAVAESARRAVDRCSPLNLPPDKYAVWRDIDHELRPRGCDQRLMSATLHRADFGSALARRCVWRWLAPCPAAARSSSSTSPRAWSSRCRSRSPSSTARPAAGQRAAARSPTWSAPISSARACSGRSTGAPSSRRLSSCASLPRFADWRQINAQALVTGAVTGGEDGGDLERRVPPVGRVRRQQMRGLRFATAADNWRRVAHKIADAVYERITGETGYFDTRIVYVAESGPRDRPRQAPRDHGPGRRQPPLPDRRRRPRADAALPSRRRRQITYHGLRRARAAGLSARPRPPGASSSSAISPA